MTYALVADAVLLLHTGIAMFIVFGLPAIWAGAFLGWRWVRNPLFRWTHLGLMGLVLAESLLGLVCPLTQWENALRYIADDHGRYPESFMAYWLGRLLYHDLSPLVFGTLYALFFALIALTLKFVPIRKKETSNADGVRP